MDSDTQQMLEKIDRRIAKLRDIRKMIVEEFGVGENGTSDETRHTQRKSRRVPQERMQRKTQIHEWLKAHGPATRAEIIEGTKLPEGTVGGYLSAQKDLFENRDGKWHAR